MILFHIAQIADRSDLILEVECVCGAIIVFCRFKSELAGTSIYDGNTINNVIHLPLGVSNFILRGVDLQRTEMYDDRT